MRPLILLAVSVAALAAPLAALAQGPVPTTIRSSSLTVAQEQELQRRLGLLETQLRSLAAQTELREGAVRNIAIEILGARPDLDFETYTALIESGARELRAYITEARTRSDPDPVSASLRARAIVAAENGLLTDARALYDQLITANRAARQQERDAEDLADAADMAEAARLAFVAADFRDAARRYEAAAELAPASARERFRYRFAQAMALTTLGERFGDPTDLRAAVNVYQLFVLPLAPRSVSANDWAATQHNLGYALGLLGERGDGEALRSAVRAYRAALEVRTRADDPENWATTQNNLGVALRFLGAMGDVSALRESVQTFRLALEVRVRTVDPSGWADTSINLGIALGTLGQNGDDQALRQAVAIYRSVLEIYTRADSPADWAAAQINLGHTLYLLGAGGDDNALREAVAVIRSALEVQTRESNPIVWAHMQYTLGTALSQFGARGNQQALRDAIIAFRAALEVQTRATPRPWAWTQLRLAIACNFQVLYGDNSARREGLEAGRAALDGFEQIGDTGPSNLARQVLAQLDQR